MSFPWQVTVVYSLVFTVLTEKLQLECSSDEGPSILQRMTLSYTLGDQHGLYEPMKAAQAELGFY